MKKTPYFAKMKLSYLHFCSFILLFRGLTCLSLDNKEKSDSNGNNMLDCCNATSIKSDRVVVKLGYLTAVKGNMHNRQGRAISGALSYAIEQINNCSCVLPDVKLEFVYKDTEGKENKSTEAIVDLICQ